MKESRKTSNKEIKILNSGVRYYSGKDYQNNKSVKKVLTGPLDVRSQSGGIKRRKNI